MVGRETGQRDKELALAGQQDMGIPEMVLKAKLGWLCHIWAIKWRLGENEMQLQELLHLFHNFVKDIKGSDHCLERFPSPSPDFPFLVESHPKP